MLAAKQWLASAYGWPAASLAYAVLHLVVCLPLHLAFIPRADPGEPVGHGLVMSPQEHAGTPASRPAFILLTAILTLTALTSSMLSVHILTLFERRGLSLAAAVSLGALLGPAQVGARVLEMLVGRRLHPVWTMIASLGLIASGLGLLLLDLPIPALAVILYGAGNGLHTIARGALPLVLFDPRDYAVLMGRLAAPSLAVQALAPSFGAWLLVGDGTVMLVVLTAIILSALGLSLLLRSHSG